MDFIKGMKTWDRMCRKKSCMECDLGSNKNRTGSPCRTFARSHPAEAMEVLKEWDEENPLKTNMTLLHEKYPDKPWQKYHGRGECITLTCALNSPCHFCDWWQEEA